ncbi:hypothetical protein BDV28DRAFT_140554 [Aspergillus coremiiformis]|uniref:Uncharacterized protein n=1 Tax=Aspergillus coremiiformis TaxID=138285 RepID=A0A5N6YXS9_9EURO|nr:hypothetical protein BDV28DRAFT_140554 [Aspergillus coremiiformis]
MLCGGLMVDGWLAFSPMGGDLRVCGFGAFWVTGLLAGLYNIWTVLWDFTHRYKFNDYHDESCAHIDRFTLFNSVVRLNIQDNKI